MQEIKAFLFIKLNFLGVALRHVTSELPKVLVKY